MQSPGILISCFHIKDFLFSSTAFPIVHVHNTDIIVDTQKDSSFLASSIIHQNTPLF